MGAICATSFSASTGIANMPPTKSSISVAAFLAPSPAAGAGWVLCIFRDTPTSLMTMFSPSEPGARSAEAFGSRRMNPIRSLDASCNFSTGVGVFPAAGAGCLAWSMPARNASMTAQPCQRGAGPRQSSARDLRVSRKATPAFKSSIGRSATGLGVLPAAPAAIGVRLLSERGGLGVQKHVSQVQCGRFPLLQYWLA